ncbi:hypothetical protein HPP92_025619 [Vanilla planifolia]|uniref:E3 UFM1-protein ligase 1 homolog n=1 Tax=Vanilla planifolia TaxID=51239 RepID=A0A835PIC4_VANPL|nr:hypothetical protein HPP92_025619 [Vanilla planifolia]
MDAELLELQRQFEAAQLAKSSVRLSERNVVELVGKLQELHFIDFDLLHTISGKEYITTEQLRSEIVAEISKSGRVSLVDLSEIVGVDLFHVERQIQHIVSNDSRLMLTNGEIISEFYWDGVAEEINEKLQECSHISLAELASQFLVSAEIIVSVLERRLGSIIKGQLEGGQLYTPAYISRITQMVRGACRGITIPTNLSTVWNSLQLLLHDDGGSNVMHIENTLIQSIFNSLVNDGEILGSLRAGVQWTPAVFSHVQKESVGAFYSQNSYIGYDALHKLAIAQPKQYLQARYPDGIALENIFVHPSIVKMLDVAIEDAIDHENWISYFPFYPNVSGQSLEGSLLYTIVILEAFAACGFAPTLVVLVASNERVDCQSLLPIYIVNQDVSKILSYCPSVERSVKSSNAVVLGESFIFSSKYIKDLSDLVEKEMNVLSFTSLGGHRPARSLADESKLESSSFEKSEIKETVDDGSSRKNVPEKGSKKKKGKHAGSAKVEHSENNSNFLENVPTKGKRNLRKSKDTSSTDAKNSSKVKDPGLNVPFDEWIAEKIMAVSSDLRELGGGDDPNTILSALSAHLRPTLQESLQKRRSIMLQENYKRRRQMLDILQKQLDEVFLDLQLYEKSLELFEDDPSTSVVLQKHLLKTLAAPIVDKLIQTLVMDNQLRNGFGAEDIDNLENEKFISGNRASLVKSLPNSLSVKAQAVVEALEGKRVETFMTALKALAEESGLMLKKLDKKIERTLLHSYRKDIMSQVSSEMDPVLLLPKIVALVYLQVFGKALQAPGRAISAAISRLKDKLPEEAFNALIDYHSSIVTLLALQSAATEDDEDCTSDRILSQKEHLDSKLPELKSLFLKTISA